MYKLTDAINTQSTVKLHVRWQEELFLITWASRAPVASLVQHLQ
jgi:hypothetical protein